MIILGLNTALRISDILALQWQDVYDFEQKNYKNHINIVEQKTGKTTQIQNSYYCVNKRASIVSDLMIRFQKVRQNLN